MSLILEALKKLERDKQVPDRGGFLVMAARPWPSSDDTGRRLFFASLALAGCGVLGMTVAGTWWWHHRQAPGAVAAQAPVVAPIAPIAPAAAPAVSRGRAASVVPAAPQAAAMIPASVTVAPKAAAVRAPQTASAPAANLPAPAVAAAAEPVPAKKPLADLRLTAISEREGKRMAILNERTVFEGDSFDGVTVVRIGENEIELDVNGRRRVIQF